MLKSDSKSNNESLVEEPSDLFIIGGGINGCGIARDAVGRGLTVTLCEQGDLAEWTSSRSGKLIHGGLRYLEYYEFRLVREALIEREVLLDSAPHIIWPMRFVLPHSPQDRPAWLIRLGLLLYDHLGGRLKLPKTRAVDLKTGQEGALIHEQYVKGFEYSDCWVDDARLVVLNALAAHEKGANILSRTQFLSAKRKNNIWSIRVSLADGMIKEFSARALVNAAGPWVNHAIDQVEEVSSSINVRLVRGSHIIVPKFWEGDHAYLLQNSDRRVIFVNPYEEKFALIGTTDIAQNGEPDDVDINESEIDYLIKVVKRYFKVELEASDVIDQFSGVRPLFDDNAENPSAVTRDYLFDVQGDTNNAPMISIFGGKITTFRKLAEHALDKLKPWFTEMGDPWTRTAHLPGGDLPNADFELFESSAARRYAWLPECVLHHLARCYGSRIDRLLVEATDISHLGKQFSATFYELEARYLIDNEWAQTEEDILQRRTKHGLHMTIEQRKIFSNWLNSYQ